VKAALPFDPIPDAGPDAKTVELSQQELLEAIGLYVGTRTGESFPATSTLQIRVSQGELHVRYTYWRRRYVQ